MSSNGYIPKRRGVLEHLQDGRLTLLEYAGYDTMILLADKATGIWWGSAKALAAICGAGDLSERQARHLLESLEQKRYIRRFARRRGHGNYPILVNKFCPTSGAYKGMRLNAERTTDWRHPLYELCQEHGAEHGLEHGAQPGVERAPIQEREVKREERRKPSAPAQAPSREAAALTALLKQRMLENNPRAKITPQQELQWARDADLMMRRDERTQQEIREVIEWCQRDSFWKGNILSMAKLRDKFDQLTLKKNANGRGAQHGATTRDERRRETTRNSLKRVFGDS